MKQHMRLDALRRNAVLSAIIVSLLSLLGACEAPPPGSDLSAGTDASASPTPSVAASPEITNATPLQTPTPEVISTPYTAPFAVVSPEGSDPAAAAPLLIPVAGVKFEDLQNTFKDSRSDGRVHDAIDIIAPRGTPVLACADGSIVKLFNSVRGGITLYQLSEDQRTVYYYAHLDRYHEGIEVGKPLRRGEVIAYVGDTGNSTPGNYHLHFSVALVSSPRDIHNGTFLNPYDLFKAK